MKAAEWMGNNMTAAAIRLGGWAGGGFLTALCALDGCAPLAAGLAAAAPTGAAATAALAGMLPGFLLMADFGAGLRCAGIAVLAAAAVSAFRDTTWLRHPLFRPLSAAGAALIVELGRLLEAGGGLPDALRLAACAAQSISPSSPTRAPKPGSIAIIWRSLRERSSRVRMRTQIGYLKGKS